MSKLQVGVVGCGYWGPNLIRNFDSLADCDMRVVCDLDSDRLSHMKSRFPGLETTNDFDKFVADPKLDAIVVATSVSLHHPMAKAALEAGKHVFVEKPMARSTAECDELRQLSREKGLTFMVGHTFLYSSPVRKIKEIVQNGDIGKVLYISSRRLNLGLFQKDINVTWDLAPHDISIILYLLDELPQTVNCRGNAHITDGVEDVTNLSLQFSNDRFAMIQNSWLDPRKVREMTIVGDKRMIVYDDVEPLHKIKIFDVRVETPPHYDTFAEFQYSYHYGDCHIPFVRQEEPLKVECQHFLDCVESGNLPISNAQQGTDLVSVLEASSESLKQGGAPVSLQSSAN
jgi:predicted dehydrogenase